MKADQSFDKVNQQKSMNLGDFNQHTGKAQFIYRRSPVNAHSYLILQIEEGRGDYVPAGEYTVLDAGEDPDLTEKKMINIVALLNGKRDLMDLRNLTETRLLYTILPKSSHEDKTKIIFRTHDNKGVSKENAILILEKGVLDDEFNSQTDPE